MRQGTARRRVPWGAVAPELIGQEIYALLTVYQALCALEAHAAEQDGVGPDRISFTATVQLARLTTAGQSAANPRVLCAAASAVPRTLLTRAGNQDEHDATTMQLTHA
jgi:hypothetical protein